MRKSNVYPTKTTLNLMIRERWHGDLRVMIPSALVGAVLIGLFCRYAVIERLNHASRAEQAAIQAEQTLSSVRQELTAYDEVEAEYSRYFSDALFSRDIPQECMDVLNMMEKELMSKVRVRSYSFSGNQLLLQLSMSRFGVTAELIEALYHVPMVDYVSISTATDDLQAASVTDDAVDQRDESMVIMTITLREVEGK